MRFVYVASPYTKGDVAVNVRANIEAANRIAEAGFIPFVPLLTHFWHMLFPHPYEFWCEQDMEWLGRCDCIVRLPGDSSGADAEVARARELGLPVFFGVEDLLLWARRRLQTNQDAGMSEQTSNERYEIVGLTRAEVDRCMEVLCGGPMPWDRGYCFASSELFARPSQVIHRRPESEEPRHE